MSSDESIWRMRVLSTAMPEYVGELVRCKDCAHHHEPTVEDVLREMLDAWGELPSNATNEAIIAEYASKLKLAEGEDA